MSAEIEDLDPGKYHVVFQVKAERRPKATTAEDAIMKYAKDRKEKLLAVGRSFDYAQSKGNLRNMEKSNKRCARLEDREFQKAMFKRDRKFNRMKKERSKKRRKRIDDAMREKREAAEEERKAKRKPSKDNFKEEDGNDATKGQAEAGAEDKSE